VAGCGSGSSARRRRRPLRAGRWRGKTIAVSAKEFAFDPGRSRSTKPGTYTFQLTNDGSIEHGIEVEGQDVEEELESVAPGSTDTLTVYVHEDREL
jgi:hypothetical protein